MTARSAKATDGSIAGFGVMALAVLLLIGSDQSAAFGAIPVPDRRRHRRAVGVPRAAV
jgi:hypothetical protein